MKRALLSLILLAAAGFCGADEATVAYPDGYREWTHVKSMLIQPGHALYDSFGGLHHLYANKKAMKGYRSGTFADGSIIVFDLLTATAADNATVEGPRKVLGVMEKNSRRFAATGGWGFEGFAAGDRNQRAVGANASTACFQCHAARAQNGYVFSSWRD
jgi:Cytochrome P460